MQRETSFMLQIPKTMLWGTWQLQKINGLIFIFMIY